MPCTYSWGGVLRLHLDVRCPLGARWGRFSAVKSTLRTSEQGSADLGVTFAAVSRLFFGTYECLTPTPGGLDVRGRPPSQRSWVIGCKEPSRRLGDTPNRPPSVKRASARSAGAVVGAQFPLGCKELGAFYVLPPTEALEPRRWRKRFCPAAVRRSRSRRTRWDDRSATSPRTGTVSWWR